MDSFLFGVMPKSKDCPCAYPNVYQDFNPNNILIHTHVINSVCPKFDLESLGSNEMILELKSIKIWIYT